MELAMTRSYQEKYFDEKFRHIDSSIHDVKHDVSVLRQDLNDNTRVTQHTAERVDRLEVNKPLKKSLDMKAIGIAIGTAGAIIAAAVLAFRQVLGI